MVAAWVKAEACRGEYAFLVCSDGVWVCITWEMVVGGTSGLWSRLRGVYCTVCSSVVFGPLGKGVMITACQCVHHDTVHTLVGTIGLTDYRPEQSLIRLNDTI
eukprot:jgi/Botrbrau1/11069/Bobra.0302s0011.1